ncbi:hypothetical protein [Streptomyces sp. NPDC096132]|uniref:hypothetical protein n=1 Tax=Streptomyces sp. NPDC096132 TaxID=3366075 RepID=UPI00381E52F7
MTPISLFDLYSDALDALQDSLGEAVPATELADALARLTPRRPVGGTGASAAYADAVKSAIALTLYAVRASPVRIASSAQTGPYAYAEAEPDGLLARVRAMVVRSRQAREPDGTVPVFAPGPVLVTVGKVLDGLRAALEEADRRTAAETARPAEPLPWSADDDLVDMLHDLLAAGARGREAFALARIEDLTETLSARGIRAVSYDPTDTGLAGDPLRFDFVEGARPGSVGMTLVPALVDVAADGRTLRRGRVRPAAAHRPAAVDSDVPPR